MIIKNNRIDVVISIDKDAFDRIRNNDMTNGDEVRIGISVLRGKPLPRGHGRLIYAKDVGEYLTLADVPTIIEADDEESEE